MKAPLSSSPLADLFPKLAPKDLAAKITGLKKNKLYEYALSLKGGGE
jgi:hypothetical protein